MNIAEAPDVEMQESSDHKCLSVTQAGAERATKDFTIFQTDQLPNTATVLNHHWVFATSASWPIHVEKFVYMPHFGITISNTTNNGTPGPGFDSPRKSIFSDTMESSSTKRARRMGLSLHSRQQNNQTIHSLSIACSPYLIIILPEYAHQMRISNLSASSPFRLFLLFQHNPFDTPWINTSRRHPHLLQLPW
jgi:hypothetical protein